MRQSAKYAVIAYLRFSDMPIWLVFITPTHEGMARLSWPGWRRWVVLCMLKTTHSTSWKPQPLENSQNEKNEPHIARFDGLFDMNLFHFISGVVAVVPAS